MRVLATPRGVREEGDGGRRRARGGGGGGMRELEELLNIKDGNSEFCLYAQPGANDKYFTAGFMVTLVMVEAPGTSVAVKCGDHNSIWRLDDI